MGYYYPVGQSYCINGVHYDRGGNIERDQPHHEEEESEQDDLENKQNAEDKSND